MRLMRCCQVLTGFAVSNFPIPIWGTHRHPHLLSASSSNLTCVCGLFFDCGWSKKELVGAEHFRPRTRSWTWRELELQTPRAKSAQARDHAIHASSHTFISTTTCPRQRSNTSRIVPTATGHHSARGGCPRLARYSQATCRYLMSFRYQPLQRRTSHHHFRAAT